MNGTTLLAAVLPLERYETAAGIHNRDRHWMAIDSSRLLQGCIDDRALLLKGHTWAYVLHLSWKSLQSVATSQA
jgi:hypothetical protein